MLGADAIKLLKICHFVRSKTHKTEKDPSTSSSMPLHGRDQAIQTIWEGVVNNFHYRFEHTKQMHTVFTAIGAMGIGKTRIISDMQELVRKELVKQKAHPFFSTNSEFELLEDALEHSKSCKIDFSSGDCYNNLLDNPTRLLDISVSVGIRIGAHLLFDSYTEDFLGHLLHFVNEDYMLFKDLIHLFRLHNVMRAFQHANNPEKWKILFIHFDECQKMQGKQQVTKDYSPMSAAQKSLQNAKMIEDYVLAMFRVLTKYMCTSEITQQNPAAQDKLIIIPAWSGTVVSLDRIIPSSEFRIRSLDLPLLSRENSTELLRSVYCDETLNYPIFQQYLASIGGIPRGYEAILYKGMDLAAQKNGITLDELRIRLKVCKIYIYAICIYFIYIVMYSINCNCF